MGELKNKTGKIVYTAGKTKRELVEKANSLSIQREDIVNILSGGDYYYMLYYYDRPRDN